MSSRKPSESDGAAQSRVKGYPNRREDSGEVFTRVSIYGRLLPAILIVLSLLVGQKVYLESQFSRRIASLEPKFDPARSGRALTILYEQNQRLESLLLESTNSYQVLTKELMNLTNKVESLEREKTKKDEQIGRILSDLILETIRKSENGMIGHDKLIDLLKPHPESMPETLITETLAHMVESKKVGQGGAGKTRYYYVGQSNDKKFNRL